MPSAVSRYVCIWRLWSLVSVQSTPLGWHFQCHAAGWSPDTGMACRFVHHYERHVPTSDRVRTEFELHTHPFPSLAWVVVGGND